MQAGSGNNVGLPKIGKEEGEKDSNVAVHRSFPSSRNRLLCHVCATCLHMPLRMIDI